MIRLSAILVLASISRVYGDILFPHDNQHCLGQHVEYQCIVDGTLPLSLVWTVYYSNGTQFSSPESYSSGTVEGSTTIGGVFTVEQLSGQFQAPLVSNISFTVQYSIDGYTIVCSDGTTDNVNFTIRILDDHPVPPSNVILSTNQTTLFINWTQPTNSSQCITGYTINSNTTNSIVNTTDISVTIPLAGLSPGVYCTRIAAIDTTDRISQYSEEECIELNVPLLNCSTLTSSYQAISTSIFWEFQQPIIPSLSVVYLSYNITNSTDDTVILLPANTTEYTIDLMVNVTYVFTVFGGNAIGNGTECNYTYYTESTKPSPTIILPPSSPDSSTTSAAVIAVVCIFVVLLTIIILIVTVLCVVFVIQVIRSRQQNEQNKDIIVAMKNVFNNDQALICSSCATLT